MLSDQYDRVNNVYLKKVRGQWGFSPTVIRYLLICVVTGSKSIPVLGPYPTLDPSECTFVERDPTETLFDIFTSVQAASDDTVAVVGELEKSAVTVPIDAVEQDVVLPIVTTAVPIPRARMLSTDTTACDCPTYKGVDDKRGVFDFVRSNPEKLN